MGIIGNRGGGPIADMATNMAGIQMAEKCEPDYEGMIKRLKDRNNKNIRLATAIINFFEGDHLPDQMATILGELHWERITNNKSISAIMAKME